MWYLHTSKAVSYTHLENSLGFPNVRLDKKASASSDRYCLNQNKGLKEQGIVFLEEMERLGMIIDVSHLSDAGFYDVLEHTTKPVSYTHLDVYKRQTYCATAACSVISVITDLINIQYFPSSVNTFSMCLFSK